MVEQEHSEIRRPYLTAIACVLLLVHALSIGPTLLFERFFEKKEPRRFFACSACRDRKQCPFFFWADEKITEEKQAKWMEVYQERQPTIDEADLAVRLKKARKIKDSSRR